jgi:hypothetical protein
LAGVPAGQYALNVGWYDLESGQRLAVTPAEGISVVDEAVFLTHIQREGQD